MSNENNVADRIALQDVMLKYAAGVDERDFDLYAHCRTDVQALHYLKQPEVDILTLCATYDTDMVRTDEGWKISKHRLVSRGIRQH